MSFFDTLLNMFSKKEAQPEWLLGIDTDEIAQICNVDEITIEKKNDFPVKDSYACMGKKMSLRMPIFFFIRMEKFDFNTLRASVGDIKPKEMKENIGIGKESIYLSQEAVRIREEVRNPVLQHTLFVSGETYCMEFLSTYLSYEQLIGAAKYFL